MDITWPVHPWVAEHQQQIGFALQAFPIDTTGNPIRSMLAAGRLAEELGFDAFILSYHPAWGPECRVHMAALATVTERIRLGSGVARALDRHPVMTAPSHMASSIATLVPGRISRSRRQWIRRSGSTVISPLLVFSTSRSERLMRRT